MNIPTIIILSGAKTFVLEYKTPLFYTFVKEISIKNYTRIHRKYKKKKNIITNIYKMHYLKAI